LTTNGDVGGLDQGRNLVACLKPHVLHRACGDDGGHVADGGLDDDLTQHLVRDYLLHGAGYFVANRLLHKVIVLFGDRLRNSELTCSSASLLPRAEACTADPHDSGKEIIYSGTPLVEVLKAGGLLLDSDMAAIRETVTMTVLVEATDGYRAVFSLAELDPELIDRVVLLADTKDGRPLPPREGPFRIIVPGEKRPARWVRQVKAVIVRKN